MPETGTLFHHGSYDGVTADGRIGWRIVGRTVTWDYYDGAGYFKHGVRLLSWRERWAWRLLRRGPVFP